MLLEIGFHEMVAAIFAGNILSAGFLAAFSRSFREDESNHSWPVLFGLTVPLAYFLFAVVFTGSPH